MSNARARHQLTGTPPDRRRPFFRMSFTLTPPWDADATVTIQAIVLGDTGREGEELATLDDLPELQEAGWFAMRNVGDLDVRLRIID